MTAITTKPINDASLVASGSIANNDLVITSDESVLPGYVFTRPWSDVKAYILAALTGGVIAAAALSVAAVSVVGNPTGSTAPGSDIPFTADNHLLARIAGALQSSFLTNAMVPTNTLGLDKLVNASAKGLIGATTSGAWAQQTLLAMGIADLTTANNFAGQVQFSRNVTAVSQPAIGLVHIVGDDGNARGFYADAFGANAQNSGRRANGTAAAPTALAINNAILLFATSGYGTTGYGSMRTNISIAAAEAWTDTAQGTYFTCTLTTPGSLVQVGSMFRVDVDRGIQVGGAGTANIVIDQNRIIRPRSYTLATLPTITTTGLIHCSDLGGGPGLLYSNGTTWCRGKAAGTANIAVDASLTFTYTRLTNASVIRNNVVQTAIRTVTLDATGCANGDRARFVRSAGATGAFAWDIVGNTTVSLLLAKQWVEFEFDGTQWNPIAGGTFL